VPSETMPRIEDRDGRKALVVGDYVQSVAVGDDHPFDVWDAFIPKRRLPWRVLILGAGGGTIAMLLTRRCGPIRIVAIERDPDVARLARDEFGLAHLDNVELIEADAFAWLATCDETFDLICVDMYVAGEIAHGTLATPFLRQVAERLTPGGIAAFNLFLTKRLPEQIHRLERVFNIVDRIQVGGNVVVHGMRD
jgi:spermidine synthase